MTETIISFYEKKNINLIEIEIIYRTAKQFWSINRLSVKRRISKQNFEALLATKKLITYQNSLLFKKATSFKIFNEKIEITLGKNLILIPILKKSTISYTFIDVFSGAGGFSQGLIDSGLTPLLCIDKDKDACKTLKKNHPGLSIVCDEIENFDFTKFKHKVDVVVGGSPCQSFSTIGLKKGLGDPNGQALLEFIKMIFIVQPKIFIIENVRGLLNHDKGKTFQYILNLLSKNKTYKIEYELINMAEYGVPQKRFRLFIIGTLTSLKLKNFFPLLKKYKTQVLKDVLTNVPFSEGAKYSEKKKLFKMIPPGKCWTSLPKNIQQDYLGKSWNSKGGKRGILRKLSMTDPALTLLCSPSQKQTERCHPLENRPLTIREYARIQTFKDSYSFFESINSQYRQIKNAVPILFSIQVEDKLLEVLKSQN